MNFDNTFKYAAVMVGLNKQIDITNANLTLINNEITTTNNIVGHDDLKNAKLISLRQQQTYFTDLISMQNAVKAEIGVVTGLSSTDKATLYNIFTISTQLKENYTMLMLFNHAAILSDTKLLSLVNDNVTPMDGKKLMTNQALNAYSFNTEYIGVLSSLIPFAY